MRGTPRYVIKQGNTCYECKNKEKKVDVEPCASCEHVLCWTNFEPIVDNKNTEGT